MNLFRQTIARLKLLFVCLLAPFFLFFSFSSWAVDFGIAATENNVTVKQNLLSSPLQLIIYRDDFDGPIDVDVNVKGGGRDVEAYVHNDKSLKGGDQDKKEIDLNISTGRYAENGTYEVTVTSTGTVNGQRRTRVATFTITVQRDDTFDITVKPQTVSVPQGGVTSNKVEVSDTGSFNDPVYLEIGSGLGKTLDGFSFEFSGGGGDHAPANRSDLLVGSSHWIPNAGTNGKSSSTLTITTYPDTPPGEYTFYVYGRRDTKITVDRVVSGTRDTVPYESLKISTRRAAFNVVVTADPAFIGLIEPVDFEIYPGVAEMITPPRPNFYLNQIHVSAPRSINTVKTKAALDTNVEGITVSMMHSKNVDKVNTHYLRVEVNDAAKPGTYYATVTGTSKGTNNQTLSKKTRVAIIVPDKTKKEKPKVSLNSDPKPDLLIGNYVPIDINCLGQGCTTGKSGICLGDTCPSSVDLFCPGSGCPENINITCLGDPCTNSVGIDCEFGVCDPSMSAFCENNECSGEFILPGSIFADGFESGDVTSWSDTSTGISSDRGAGTSTSTTGALTGTGDSSSPAPALPSGVDATNIHPDRDAIPPSNFDLQQLKQLANLIKVVAENCGKDLECPVIDCNKAKQFLQVLYEAKRHMEKMKGWSAQASTDFLNHRNSLVEQSIITSTNSGNAIWAQGVHQFLHNLGSLLLDIAALADTIESLATDGLDPSKVKNLDTLYETLKTYESAVNTVTSQGGDGSPTPLGGATADADEMLGLNNTSVSSLKSDLTDTISAIERFKDGKPWKAGRNVGQIVGRVLKDISQGEMDERARRIAALAQNLRAEEGVTTSAHNGYSEAVTRRNLVEDTSAALDAAYSALHACIVKHCRSAGSLTSPTEPSFTGWGQALRYYNALIPRMNTALASYTGGIEFKEREDCVDPAVSLPDPGDNALAAFAALFTGDTSISNGQVTTTRGTPVDSVVDELSKPLRPITTNCTPCQSIAQEYNRKINEIKELQMQLETAIDEQEKAQKEFDRLAATYNSYQFPTEYTNPNGKKGYSVSGLTSEGLRWTVYYYDHIGSDSYGSGYDLSDMQTTKEKVRQKRDEVQIALVEAAAKVRDLTFQRDVAYKALTGITINLVRCERQCAIVRIINVISLIGNNPFDRQDPISQESGNTNEATIQVVNNIPISRLTLIGAEPGCPNPNGNHYHGNANNCNGVFTVDPDPPGCGHGRVTSVVTIPVSSCPDL